jgi:hypothetical protein
MDRSTHVGGRHENDRLKSNRIRSSRVVVLHDTRYAHGSIALNRFFERFSGRKANVFGCSASVGSFLVNQIDETTTRTTTTLVDEQSNATSEIYVIFVADTLLGKGLRCQPRAQLAGFNWILEELIVSMNRSVETRSIYSNVQS